MPPLGTKIAQAGLTWSKRRFLITSAALGVAAFLLVFMIDAGLLAALGIGFAAGFGMPLWLLKFLKKRREAKFLQAFPDAVDVIVRGIKAGLPLLDCLRIIATDAPEPVKSEFRAIVETQTIGIPLGEACGKLYERIPVAEANFFGIVIAIQQKAGGNLSEALGNLSRVLRDRKKMKAKIQAMSMEAKASAMIIACLPLAVMILVYITSPDYISLLWTHPMGRMMMAGSARLDDDGRPGHAQDDQFRFLSAGAMVDFLIEKLGDTRFLAMLFAAIAAIATVLTLAMPLLATDSLSKRMKAVATEREKIRQRERERLARGEKVTLRHSPKQYMQTIVDQFNLNKWVGQEEARALLVQAGYRGQAPYVTYLFFRMVMPVAMLMLLGVLSLRRARSRSAGHGQGRICLGGHLFRHVRAEPVREEQDRSAASFRSSAPSRMRSTCC